METITLLNHYGPAKANTPYPVVEQGRDYVKLRVGGKALYVPSHMVDDGSYAARKERRLLESIYESRYGDDTDEDL